MEVINFKILIQKAIESVAPKAPITLLAENSIIFRGERLEITGGLAKTRRYEFQFNSVDSFLEGLRTFGLMLNYSELDRIVKIYETEKSKENETAN